MGEAKATVEWFSESIPFGHLDTADQQTDLPYKFYVLGQIGLSKQCRPRSDCF